MPDKAMFMLAVVGRPGAGYYGVLSAYDLSRTSRDFLDQVNADLRALPRGHTDSGTRKDLHLYLHCKYGFGEVNAGNWYEDPRTSTDEPPLPRARFAQE